jgi:hypothetical protein
VPSIAHVLAVLMLVLGCATTDDSLSSSRAPTDESRATATSDRASDSGAQVMSALEQRLLDAQQVDLAFDIQSSGAVISSFSGSVHWVRDGELLLRATGEFAGEPQHLELRGDAQTLAALVDGQQVWAGPRPVALIEAIVLGLTRQGLLHNLAMLTMGAAPERGDGGMAEWITFVEPKLGPLEPFGADQARPLEFGIEVEGQPIGRATLWLRTDGLPIERHQTVEFPEGSMQVVERYPSFTTN